MCVFLISCLTKLPGWKKSHNGDGIPLQAVCIEILQDETSPRRHAVGWNSPRILALYIESDT